MYGAGFYFTSWLISAFMLIPVIIFGIVYYIFLGGAPAPKEQTIKDFCLLTASIHSKEDLESLLSEFRKKYTRYDEHHIDVWLESVTNLAKSHYWDTDAVALFGQELENKNLSHKKVIANTISAALKMKEIVNTQGA
ncbi:hypothetical protein BKH43_00140 [Helicobacter sp. 13S00401-1]|uniref:hypothetical protein n=1 Tax=Helicobacter sp. 13S00401-1 TaxID=1905758 RepID=UPI000BA5C645|nr:hypothetical protein [Helicobacter sp. 13S00401-1]PAF51688.1 hypothetical protein BKH43_00140 [Helicobacter sp. 13S00401-1]